MFILELSKALIYEFNYNYIKSKYSHNSRLLFTDIDNLSYETKTENIYEDFANDKEMFDSSNYWTKLIYYDDLN